MLKIYLATISYKIKKKDEVIDLNSYSNYTIKEEQNAVHTTKEFSAYADNISELYNGSCYVDKKKRGRFAVFVSWDYDVYLKEWKCPDAKLIMSTSYQETQCSMQQLFKLEANQVIAYLKQEGIILSIPS